MAQDLFFFSLIYYGEKNNNKSNLQKSCKRLEKGENENRLSFTCFIYYFVTGILFNYKMREIVFEIVPVFVLAKKCILLIFIDRKIIKIKSFISKKKKYAKNLTLNWLEWSNLWKSGSKSSASSRFCKNWRWNVKISCILPKSAAISACDRNVSRFNGSK